MKIVIADRYSGRQEVDAKLFGIWAVYKSKLGRWSRWHVVHVPTGPDTYPHGFDTRKKAIELARECQIRWPTFGDSLPFGKPMNADHPVKAEMRELIARLNHA